MKFFTKKYWALLVGATLLILGSFSTFTSADTQPTEKGTHVVLIEQLTAHDCGYCPYVDAALPNVAGDWERVALTHSHYSVGSGYNTAVNTRTTELASSIYP